MKAKHLIWFFSLSVASVYGQTVPPRMSPHCGMFSDRMAVCFGGILGNIESIDKADYRVFSLSFDKVININEIGDRWEYISVDNQGVQVTPRTRATSIAISDHELLITGGIDSFSTKMVDQNIVFDVNTKTWRAYPQYTEGTYGNRQIYFSSATLVEEKRVAVFGGYELLPDPSWSIPSKYNLTRAFDTNFRYIGYTSVNYLNTKSTIASEAWTVNSNINDLDAFYSRLQSVYYQNTIYYIGGNRQDMDTMSDIVTSYFITSSLSKILKFNTETNTWQNVTSATFSVPSTRFFHTLTMLPNEPGVVLLYGGEKDTIVAADPCYILNLNTLAWTQVNINTGTVVRDLRRSRHSAILVDNNTLMISFGLDSTGALASSHILLNITSSSSVSLLATYTPIGVETSDSNSTQTKTQSPTQTPTQVANTKGSNSLGTGAIVGIAIGIVAVIAIVVIGIFLYRRRDNKNRNEKYDLEPERRVRHESHENLEVDWDAIENEYPKNSGSFFVTTQTPNSAQNDLSVSHNDSHSQPSNLSETKVHSVPDGVIGHTSKNQFIMKPDAGAH